MVYWTKSVSIKKTIRHVFTHHHGKTGQKNEAIPDSFSIYRYEVVTGQVEGPGHRHAHFILSHLLIGREVKDPTDGRFLQHGQAVRQAGRQTDSLRQSHHPLQGTAAHLSRPLAQLPADSGHVPGVCGEPLLAVVQRAALCRVLDTDPQAGDGALRHRLHLPEQDGHPQDQRGCGADNRQNEGRTGRRERRVRQQRTGGRRTPGQCRSVSLSPSSLLRP